MPQTIKDFRQEAKKFEEWFDAFMTTNGYKKDSDRFGMNMYGVKGKDGADLQIGLDITDEGNFRSIWLYVFAPYQYENKAGRKHHKHHACLFQEHQPKKKGARSFPLDCFWISPELHVKSWLADNFVEIKTLADK